MNNKIQQELFRFNTVMTEVNGLAYNADMNGKRFDWDKTVEEVKAKQAEDS